MKVEQDVDEFIRDGEWTRILWNQIGNLPRLDQSEERALLGKAKEGCRKSRNRLAVSWLWVAGRYAGRYGKGSYDDAFQGGAEAILNNVMEWDPKKGSPPAFLDYPVRRAIANQMALMRSPCSVPYYVHEILWKLARVRGEMAQRLQCEPEIDELVEGLRTVIKTKGHVRINRGNVSRWLGLLGDLSVSVEGTRRDDGALTEEMIADERNGSVGNHAVDAERMAIVREFRDVLDYYMHKPGSQVTRLAFGIDGDVELTQQEIARILGVSQTGVSFLTRKFRALLAKDSRVQELFERLQELDDWHEEGKI